MRKPKRILALLTIVLLLMAGCRSESVAQSTTVCLSEHFDTLNDLKQGATNIVEVEVLDHYVVTQGDMPFTISNVKTLTSIKGDTKKDDKIKVIETGDTSFGGINVMQAGEHLILFVKPFVGPQVTGAYVILGVWQGKFKVGKGSNGKVEQQAPSEYKLKDYKPVSLSKFIQKLKG